MGYRKKMRAKSSRSTAEPLDNLLFEATSARVVASSASKSCPVVLSDFSSALIFSRSVAISSMPALVATSCISASSSVSRVHFSPSLPFQAAFVVPSSSFEAFNSSFVEVRGYLMIIFMILFSYI